jgi:hypothetical protein
MKRRVFMMERELHVDTRVSGERRGLSPYFVDVQFLKRCWSFTAALRRRSEPILMQKPKSFLEIPY